MREIRTDLRCPRCKEWGMSVSTLEGYEETSCLKCGWTEYGDSLFGTDVQSSFSSVDQSQKGKVYSLWREGRLHKTQAERFIEECKQNGRF